jgi:hypothetical protein
MGIVLCVCMGCIVTSIAVIVQFYCRIINVHLKLIDKQASLQDGILSIAN